MFHHDDEDEHLMEIEAEKDNLVQNIVALEKSLEKQKEFHRKFADDVIVSESIRNEDFAKKKRLIARILSRELCR